MAVQPGLAGVGALLRVRGRAGAPARAGGTARLACGRLLLGRETDINSASIGIEIANPGHPARPAALRGRADRQRDRARAGHRPALADRARAGARPFGRRARAQARPRRGLPLGAPAPGRRRPLGRARTRCATAASSSAATRACRSRRSRRCSPCTATASRSPAASTTTPRRWSPPSSAISGPSASTGRRRLDDHDAAQPRSPPGRGRLSHDKELTRAGPRDHPQSRPRGALAGGMGSRARLGLFAGRAGFRRVGRVPDLASDGRQRRRRALAGWPASTAAP